MARVLLTLLFALALAPAASAAELLRTDLRTDGATRASCLQPRTGPGVLRRTVVTDGNGLIRARLRSGDGDWDLAVFSATGSWVAGSAHAGAAELAEGFVAAGRTLTVQACRRPGAARLAQLSVQNLLVPAAGPGTTQLVRVHLANAAEKDLLVALDLDLTEHGRAGYLDVLLHGDADRRVLGRSGLRFEVLAEDLKAADAAARRLAGPPDGTMPSGRVAYRHLAEYSEDLKKLAADNPGLVKLITLPHPSLEGRPIEGVEITEHVAAADGKPVFLNMGVHHAREWPSGEMAIEWAFELVNRFKAGDARAVELLKRARAIVVPVVNPDGFNLSREEPVDGGSVLTDLGFAYKRKNCRVEDGALPAPGECGQAANRDKGTDPNRNYGGFWGGPGAAKSPTSDTYRGAGPFSEPETQNIHALVSSHQVTTLITNHTYSDLILRPPGVASAPPPPDDALAKDLADAMAAENGYTSQPSYDLYDTTGSTEDWSYYATGGLGYTFEIGRYDNVSGGALTGAGFHPPYPSVIAEWFGKTPGGGGNREAYYVALESAANEQRHAVIAGTGTPGATLRVRKTFVTEPMSGGGFREALTSAMQVPATGRFAFHVNQSTRPLAPEGPEAWTLTCEDGGRVLGRQDVVVGRGERRDVGDACAGTAAEPARLTLAAMPLRASIRTLLRRGLTVKVACSATCDVAARIVSRSGTVRRTGVTTATLRLKPTRRAARALRRARRATLRLRVVATAGGETATATRTLRLKR